MNIQTFDLAPGLEGAFTPQARLARWSFRNGKKNIDRQYVVKFLTTEANRLVADAFRADEFTDFVALINTWFTEHNINAVALDKFREIYFERDEDRTMFVLRWAAHI